MRDRQVQGLQLEVDSIEMSGFPLEYLLARAGVVRNGILREYETIVPMLQLGEHIIEDCGDILYLEDIFHVDVNCRCFGWPLGDESRIAGRVQF